MMNDKTLEANSIPIPPQLAGLLKQTLGRTGTGFDEGAFLQQLHYWTTNAQTTGWVMDGVKWIYNSLKVWLEQFPWMSEYGLRKAIANLKKLGLIETAQHWITSYRRVMFYRIDYEKLNVFAENLCDHLTARCVNSDRVDVRSDHTSRTETSSNTSFPEQQTDVGLEEAVEPDGFQDLSDRKSVFGSQPANAEVGKRSPAGSGKNSKAQNSEFPELMNVVAQAIGLAPGAPLPASLKGAIAQSPDRVRDAIAYLHYQQQRRQIENPVGYLYQAIVEGWDLSICKPSASMLPTGFGKWFAWAKVKGWVMAATMINDIHHTLHTQMGWMPTESLMQILQDVNGTTARIEL